MASTLRPEVLGGIGGFSGLFTLDLNRYPNPVLVAGTDGVGTKLKIAQLVGKHDTVGIDLVAMCVNDILVTGAEPLFYLDYLACGKLEPQQAEEVVAGVAALREAAVPFRGETAEMPDFYPEGNDLAGFAVGVVNRCHLGWKKDSCRRSLIGLASSGVHSNGYSLVRHTFKSAASLQILLLNGPHSGGGTVDSYQDLCQIGPGCQRKGGRLDQRGCPYYRWWND